MKKSELFFTAILVPLDFTLVFLAGITAYNLRFGWLTAIRPAVLELPMRGYMLLASALAAIFVITFALAGLYSVGGARRLKFEMARVFVGSASGMAIAIAAIFFRGELFSSRFIVLAAWLFAFIYTAIGRVAIRLIQRQLIKFGIGIRKIVIIGGDDPTTTVIASDIDGNPKMGFRIVMQIPTFNDDYRQQITELHDAGEADEILVTDPNISRELLADVLAFTQSQHLAFKYSADLLATRASNLDIGALAGVPIVEVKETRLDGWGRIYKRLFDIIGSIALIIVTSPIMLVTAIAVKLNSPGPVFFHLDDGTLSRRVGEHGKSFSFLKFRSMYFGTHAQRYNELSAQNERTDGPLVKIKNDPRITRVGVFIRKYSIDELPQLFSILWGEMSLVGPRPHLPEEVAKYTDRQRRVLAIKPGLTGMAQVSGRAKLNFDDEVRLDTYYIENWTPWLDFAILLKTPLVVVTKKGAS